MPAPRNIIVTAANDLYLPLALGMLRSLRAHAYKIPFDIGVIDVGLGAEAKAQFETMGVKIVASRADIDYPGREAWEKDYPAFRALTARPFLRDYFPGYGAYMWFDADAWAQTPEAVDTMLAGAGSGDGALYIACEIDRDYKPYFLSSQPWDYHLKWYCANFPAEQVTAIFPRPMLNAGVWAMSAASPVWQAWADTYGACLKRAAKMTREQFMCDQLSLNVAVYSQGLPLRIMPAEYNWLSLYALPMFDEAAGFFTRATPPRAPISILHLTHEKKLRSFDLATVAGGGVTRALTNPAGA